jgi:AcrR family transcriptional regulator
MTDPPTTRAPLSRERVLAAALAFADAHGVEALSMRKLAGELGVEAMSLYKHVGSKAEIVDGIVAQVLDEIDRPEETGDWEDAIRRYATSAHRAFIAHPWATKLVMLPPRDPVPRLRYIDWLLGRLAEGGFPPELCYRGYHQLDAYIMGFSFWEAGHSTLGDDAFVERLLALVTSGAYPHLAQHAQQHEAAPADDGEREFQFGLDLILDGLKRAR